MPFTENKKITRKKMEAFNNFTSELNELRDEAEIFIKGLDPKNPEDQRILVEEALRGKSTEEYIDIIGGISEARELANTTEERDYLSALTWNIMEIGDSRGIVWN